MAEALAWNGRGRLNMASPARVHLRGDAWMRLAPGLHRIGSDVVNVYLIEDAAGITIVDAGLPGHWRELERELTELGRSLGQAIREFKRGVSWNGS